MAKQRKNSPGFEESIARLEEIIRLTEAPVTELEDMIALVEEGDIIEIDIPAGKINLAVSDEVLAKRKESVVWFRESHRLL